MESSKPPISRDLVGVAELAATVPDREDELLRRGFEALADALPCELAVFLELDGPTIVLRAAVPEPREPDATLRRRTRIADAHRLRAVIDAGDCLKVDDPALRDELENALGGAGSLGSSGETLLVPVAAGGERIGLLVFDHGGERVYGDDAMRVATVCGSLVALGILATRQADEVERYRSTLEERNRLLVEEVAAETDACRALERCVSRPMRRLVRMAKQVAVTDSPVLITGETGTGKEVLARAIHAWSTRADGPFVELNCAALPENLVESELFGHKKGAFSGATADRPGRFRVADGGTLLLDEIGDLAPGLQVKLLRVLQEGKVQPVGADRSAPVDVRIIAATNVDLDAAVADGRFREDLFYRLHVFPLTVPPLRGRPEDLPPIVEQILERAARRTGRGPWSVSQRTLRRMGAYDWPGNVRELVNTLERARVLSPMGGPLEIELPGQGHKRRRGRPGAWRTLKEHERAYIEEVLTATRGKIYGKGGAAALLGLPPTTLQSRMRRLGVDAASFRD